MTFDELKSSYTEIMKDPVANADKAVTLLSEIEKDYQTLASFPEKLTEYEDRVRKLQDTNQRLFLMTTGAPAEKDEDEPKELSFAEKMALKEKELTEGSK